MSKYAVDFDGVLWDGEKLREDIVGKIDQLRKDGHTVYLWTARQGAALDKCLDIIDEAGLVFDELPDGYKKIAADYYIDDRTITLSDFLQRGKNMDKSTRQVRMIPSKFTTREEGEEKKIEGYFAVFNSNYDIGPGMSESVAPGAFSNTLSGDIRALVNHDTTLVLGRTKAHTLELHEDEHGLFGSIAVNSNDSDAMNLYERVKRGDVDGCSFGFDINDEESEFRDDGSIHWTIKDVTLYEVSCCTFPAYEETNISAREKDRDTIRERETQAWRERMKKELDGAEEPENDPEEPDSPEA